MAEAGVPSVLSIGGPLSTGERFKPSGWAEEGDQDPYAAAEAAHKEEAKKRKALAEAFEKRRPQEEAETERAYAGAEKAMAQPRPAPYRAERVESPPKPEDYHKMSMEYLGAMVLLGAFGGKFIRNAANAPLAAFNGALTGWQEGNLEAYKEKSAEWKEKQQQVLDNNRARLDEYRAILEDRNASIQEQMDRVKLVAAKHQDKLWYDRADAENYTGIGQAHDQSVAVHERAQAATDKLVERHTKTNDGAVERANLWKAHLATPQGQQELAQLDRRSPGAAFEIRAFVDQWADKDQLPAPGPAGGSMPTEPAPGTPMPDATARMPPELRGPNRETDPKKFRLREERIRAWKTTGEELSPEEQIRLDRLERQPRSQAGLLTQRYMEEHPDATYEEAAEAAAEQAARMSGARTIGTYGVKLEQSGKAVDLFADQALEASKALPRGKWVVANKAIQAFQSGTSDPRVYDLGFALFSLVNAYSRAINPQGVPRIADKDHATEFLSTATSPEALAKVIARLKLEVTAEQEATEATKERRPVRPIRGGGAGEGGGGVADPLGIR